MNLVYAVILGAVSAHIKGVHPNDLDLYKNNGGFFHCLEDPSIRIPYGRINDDYCDCPDGSDEPGTSACSRGKFWCANEGHVGAFIPSRFVNDGKCDYDLCCDGSDEAPGVCPNRCTELAEEKERIAKAKKEKLDRGLKAREVFVLKAKELRKDLGSQITGLESDLQIKHVQLQEAYAELQRIQELKDSNKLDDELDPVAEGQLNDARLKIRMAYDIIDMLKNSYEKKRIYADQLENVLELMKSNYNPNFNDAAVKQAINSFEDAKGNQDDAPTIDGDQLLQAPLDGESVIDSLNILFASTRVPVVEKSYWQELSDRAVDWLIEKSVLPARRVGGVKASVSGSSSKLQEAEALVEKIKKETQDLEEKISAERSKYETLQGPDDVFRGLENVCVKQMFGEYEYEVCYYNQASQRGNGQFSVLGNHKSYRVVEDHLEFKYTDGARCWNGPPRSANVIVRCGETNELLKVEEIEKCVYSIEMLSPVACFPETQPVAEGLTDPIHEDL